MLCATQCEHARLFSTIAVYRDSRWLHAAISFNYGLGSMQQNGWGLLCTKCRRRMITSSRESHPSSSPWSTFWLVERFDHLLHVTSGVDQWNHFKTDFIGLLHRFPVAIDRIARHGQKVGQNLKKACEFMTFNSGSASCCVYLLPWWAKIKISITVHFRPFYSHSSML